MYVPVTQMRANMFQASDLFSSLLYKAYMCPPITLCVCETGETTHRLYSYTLHTYKWTLESSIIAVTEAKQFIVEYSKIYNVAFVSKTL